jgi:hypothetical protein
MKKESEKKSASEKPKSKLSLFFSKMGYSVWMIVMVIGGILAFITSLLLL